MTHSTVLPEGWVKPRGYANGVVAEGRMVFIGGQIGWDPKNPTPTFSDDFTEQFAATLRNVMAVLISAGGQAEHLVRLTVYVTDKREYLAALKPIGQRWKEIVGPHYPAMALVQVVALVEDRAKVEIEATAVIPR